MWHEIGAVASLRRQPGAKRWLVLPLTGLLLAMVVGASLHARPALGAGTTLKQAAEARGIKFGTAVTVGNSNLTSNQAYANIVASQFDVVTPGNEMKWGSVEPTQNQFNWGPADQIVAIAQANKQGVRGHNLVWTSQLPGWLTTSNFTGPQILQLMQNHVTTEATRFAGKVISWDVVNEPFNEDGTFQANIFEQAAGGSSYIATALRAARAADPNAKLYLNDFNIEGVNAKSTAMLNLVTSLKQQGVPIDAVGLESHFIEGQNPTDIQQNIARFTAAGVAVWITELDDRITLTNGQASAAQLAQQATDYANVVKACLAVTGCVGITVWGFTDLDSWIPGFFPGQGAADIYDANLQPKPSFNSTLQALGGTPPTPTPTPSATATPTPTPTPTGGALTATPVVASSGPFFNEEDVKLANSTALTSLTVTIVVQRTTGVSFSGQFNTAGGKILQSNSSTSSAVTYTFTLASGQTLTPGTYTLAAQTNGSGTAHPTTGDTFTVTSSAGNLSGHF